MESDAASVWREKARRLRVIAALVDDQDTRENLERAATDCDRMAEEAEARAKPKDTD